MLHDYVKATIGFEGLAKEVDKNATSIKRMLGPGGNPTAANLSALLVSLKNQEGGTFQVGMTR